MAQFKKASRTGTATTAIINYLTMIGWLVYRNNTVGVWDEKRKKFRKPKQQRKGLPDICGTDWLGRSVYVEVKTGSDRLSVDQTMFAAEAIGRSAFYCIAGHIQDVIQTLQIYGYAVNESGHVMSAHKKRLIDTIFDPKIDYIPNAHKLKKLNAVQKAILSKYVTDNQQKLIIKQWLGKYAERVI